MEVKEVPNQPTREAIVYQQGIQKGNEQIVLSISYRVESDKFLFAKAHLIHREQVGPIKQKPLRDEIVHGWWKLEDTNLEDSIKMLCETGKEMIDKAREVLR